MKKKAELVECGASSIPAERVGRVLCAVGIRMPRQGEWCGRVLQDLGFSTDSSLSCARPLEGVGRETVPCILFLSGLFLLILCPPLETGAPQPGLGSCRHGPWRHPPLTRPNGRHSSSASARHCLPASGAIRQFLELLLRCGRVSPSRDTSPSTVPSVRPQPPGSDSGSVSLVLVPFLTS